jgi:hypothetical protein
MNESVKPLTSWIERVKKQIISEQDNYCGVKKDITRQLQGKAGVPEVVTWVLRAEKREWG